MIIVILDSIIIINYIHFIFTTEYIIDEFPEDLRIKLNVRKIIIEKTFNILV